MTETELQFELMNTMIRRLTMSLNKEEFETLNRMVFSEVSIRMFHDKLKLPELNLIMEYK